MSDYERLSRAFARLHERNIATALILHGTTGVRDDNLKDFLKAAAEFGSADWVGTHVGAYEHGGAFWDDRGVLRFRRDGAPVVALWFSFNHRRPELADILTQALRGEGLTVEPRERETDCVIVHLGGGR